MKPLLWLLSALLWLSVGTFAHAAPPIPPLPNDWVTDTAGLLSEPVSSRLNARLAAHEQRSGQQIVVWIGKTTGDMSLEEWTSRAFQEWRIGRKGLDDGIALFLFTDDRTARIEIGYGLENRIPDATAARILRETILPRLEAGDRDGAVTTGVERLLAVLGDTGANTGPAPTARPWTWLQTAAALAVALVLLALAIRYPDLALLVLSMLLHGGNGGDSGFRGRGGKSGGGGASGRW